MSRKIVLAVGGVLVLLAVFLGWGVMDVRGQGGDDNPEDQFEPVPIFTTATDSVGIGTYVAAEAFATPAGEDPAEQPPVAYILPYAIHPNMGLETIEDFVQPEPVVEGFTFEWSLEAPEESASELISGTVAIFLADVEGKYVLTLTATDANGNAAETSWNVYATTYVGNGGVVGEPEMTNCAFCHEDTVAGWQTTGHATMFTRSIDGLTSDHYGPNCISCHTTGFYNREGANNGGFDDVAAEAGWTFPEAVEPGNWSAMVDEFPEVAALANVQCESCHGPGNLHVTAATPDESMIGLGLAYGTCAQCHAEEPYHIYPQQWEVSAHAQKNAMAFTYPIGEEEAACVGCHTGGGFIDAAAGKPVEERRTDYQVITCAVCHDPHDAANPNQLRVFDAVILPDGTDVSGQGAGATCMSCHNARTDPVASVEGERFSTPHYSTAAELMSGTGGYTWGLELPTSTHGRVVEQACIGCHMGATPGMDDAGTPDDNSDDTPLPGHNTVGGHTFAMVSSVDETENSGVCQQGHDGATSFEFVARYDYDGDGTEETNEAEVAGLLEAVQGQLEAQGVVVLDHYPYFELPEGAGPDIKGAVYNFKFSRDDAAAVHNLRYTVALLQLSYEKLAGEPLPNAYILPPKE